jgi:predicted metal-binding membrane protein
MKKSTFIIIIFLISISASSWLVSIRHYDTMMSSMMMFYNSPVALSLYVIIWTAGMAAMMFPAIIPTILFYNRLIDNNSSNSNINNSSNTATNHNSQTFHHRNRDIRNDSNNNDNWNIIKENENKTNRIMIHSLRYILQSKSYQISLFLSSYLAIWALTGISLFIAWSVVLDALLLQPGMNNSQQMEPEERQISINTIHGIVLIISGIYQFSSLKTRCLGYCESPLSFFMRRWRKGKLGAVMMGAYHGIYCLGCCWPYFLLMVALGWMNVLWMGLFAAIIFAEKIWSKGGLWIAKITGIGFITIGILCSIGIISLSSDSVNNDDDNTIKSIEMSPSSSDSLMSHDKMTGTGSDNELDVEDMDSSRKDMKNMIMSIIGI